MEPTPAPAAIEALALLQAAVDHALKEVDESLWQVPDADLPVALDHVHALDGQISALKLKVIREIETRSIPAAVGATSLRAYLAARLRISPTLARDDAQLSESLATRYAELGAALATGRVGHEQAKAISDTLDGLPSKTTFEQREWAQNFLLNKAALFDARDLRRLGKSIDNRIDPDGTPDREEAARTKRALHVKDNHDGTQSLRWTDTDENMAFAKAALEALAKPLPGEDGERDPRQAPERRADAMVDIVRRALDAGEFDPARGVRPHLHVTFTAEAMRGEPGAPPARTATGDHISPSVLQRLLCDASLTGILVDGNGVPLKMGRTKRTATPAQWVALVARDGGCCFPACTRPALYTQVPPPRRDEPPPTSHLARALPRVDQRRRDRPGQDGPLLHRAPSLSPRQRMARPARPRRTRRSCSARLGGRAATSPPQLALAPPTRSRQPRTTGLGTVTVRQSDLLVATTREEIER